MKKSAKMEKVVKVWWICFGEQVDVKNGKIILKMAKKVKKGGKM